VLLLLQHAPPEEFKKRLNIFSGWIPFLVEQLKDDKIKVRCQSCGRMDQRRSVPSLHLMVAPQHILWFTD
jgi:hypothetical protein